MTTSGAVVDFTVVNAGDEPVLWITRWPDGKWSVHRWRINGTDSVNMGRMFSDAGLLAILRFYAERGMVRVPWREVQRKIEKWAAL